MEDIKQFNVLVAFGIEGVNHEPGEVVELTAEQAAGLPAGTVSAVEEAPAVGEEAPVEEAPAGGDDVLEAPKAGDVCTLEDGSDGVLEDQEGALVCVAQG